MKRWALLLLVVVVVAGWAIWWNRQTPESSTPQTPNQSVPEDLTPQTSPPSDERQGNNPMVTIQMESGAEIKIELYPDVAPNTVANFVHLARQGFYDGTIFHRVIPGFMIQGGDPDGTGRGGPGYSIRGEFSLNGFPNNLKHTRGVVSMARTPDFNSAGSQFFIMVADVPDLDGQYAAFGKVVSGMEEVDRIVSVRRNLADRPIQDQRMVKVTVEWDEEDVEPEKYVP